MPPNGKRGSDATRLFMKVEPASSSINVFTEDGGAEAEDGVICE
jgi:hypothetical protein